MQRAKAEYSRYLHLEKKFWQQKAGYDWFKNDSGNTRFFQSMVK